MIFAICFNIMVLSIWFLTEFKIHLLNTVYNKEWTAKNIDEFLFLKFDQSIFGTDFTTAGMISCEFCFGFWLAAIAAIFLGVQFLPVIYISQMFGFLVIKKLNS